MNKLSPDRRAAILMLLREGKSLRSITGAGLETATKLLVDSGRPSRKS